MDYRTVAEARQISGLRLVLTADNPGPWGEAAKAVFRVKGLTYTPVRQDAGGNNDELRAWTAGHRNAPIAILDNEPPRAHWLDILQLAERLAPEPPLIPAMMADRIQMLGMIHELAGDKGLGWYRRLLIFQPLMKDPQYAPMLQNMSGGYGYSEGEVALAEARCIEVLALLSEQLRQQQAQGRHFFISDRLSALDLYWAAFSNMVAPMVAEDCPMSEATRAAYSILPEAVMAAADPLLIEHRDRIWRDVIGVPLDF